MKKTLFLCIAICITLGLGLLSASAKNHKPVCTTIQDGTIYGSDGSLLTLGSNEWGYNYQAHLYKGAYCDYHPLYRPGGAGHDTCVESYGDTTLAMKWNDAWLSNKDCDGDGLLNRHYGYDSYVGSGAWLTNHEWGTCFDEYGNEGNYVYFVKIVAAPEDGYTYNGNWYQADGTLIGPVIWGSFAIIEEIYNNTCTGEHGVNFKSPVGPGFGKF
ncbi:MAG: hypothetical protein K9M15_03085 [Candidatus Marinimicrobia bacterium]|nr:hypothetical protein [Candidatus Neomarinimicrobiota bacterium]